MDAMYTSRSIQLEAPMAMPRSGHQWACIITCPGHNKDDENDEDDEDDENGEDWLLGRIRIGMYSQRSL